MKIDDKIELNWTLKVNYTVTKYDVFEALVNLCTACCGDTPERSDDYAQFVTNWLKDNLLNYIKDFLDILDIDCNTDGEIRYENITELLDNEEFMKDFRQYLND